MVDTPTRVGIRIAGLIPNVVSFDNQGKPYYRKINAAPETPTLVQPETSKLVSISSETKELQSSVDSAAIKREAQAEKDYKEGISDYKTLTKLIENANKSSNPNDFSKALEYTEQNESSLSHVMEPSQIRSLQGKLKSTATNIRASNLALVRINDALGEGNVVQARVIAEESQSVLAKTLGETEASKYIDKLKQAETEHRTSGLTIDKISKAIDMKDYTTARQLAESNREILNKTVGTEETAKYISQIQEAETAAKTPAATKQAAAETEYTKRGIAPVPESELPISTAIRSVTEPVSKALSSLMPTTAEAKEAAKKDVIRQAELRAISKVSPELAKTADEFGMNVYRFAESAYQTAVPGAVEFAGQTATAIEAAAKHPEIIAESTAAGGVILARQIETQAKEDPYGLAGSFAGMYFGGKVLKKIAPSAKVVTEKIAETEAAKAISVSEPVKIIRKSVNTLADTLEKEKITLKSTETAKVIRRATADIQTAIKNEQFAIKSSEPAKAIRKATNDIKVALGKETEAIKASPAAKAIRRTVNSIETNLTKTHEAVSAQAIKKEVTAGIKAAKREIQPIVRTMAGEGFETPSLVRKAPVRTGEWEAIRPGETVREAKIRHDQELRTARAAKEVMNEKQREADALARLPEYLERFREVTREDLKAEGANLSKPSVIKNIDNLVEMERIRLTESEKITPAKRTKIITDLLGEEPLRRIADEFGTPEFKPMRGSLGELQRKGVVTPAEVITPTERLAFAAKEAEAAKAADEFGVRAIISEKATPELLREALRKRTEKPLPEGARAKLEQSVIDLMTRNAIESGTIKSNAAAVLKKRKELQKITSKMTDSQLADLLKPKEEGEIPISTLMRKQVYESPVERGIRLEKEAARAKLREGKVPTEDEVAKLMRKQVYESPVERGIRLEREAEAAKAKPAHAIVEEDTVATLMRKQVYESPVERGIRLEKEAARAKLREGDEPVLTATERRDILKRITEREITPEKAIERTPESEWGVTPKLQAEVLEKPKKALPYKEPLALKLRTAAEIEAEAPKKPTIGLLKEALGKRGAIEFGTPDVSLLRRALKERKEPITRDTSFEPVKSKPVKTEPIAKAKPKEKPVKKGFREKEAERLKEWGAAEARGATTRSKTGLVSRLKLEQKEIPKEEIKPKIAPKKKAVPKEIQETAPAYEVKAYDAYGTEFEPVYEHPAKGAAIQKLIPGLKRKQVPISKQEIAPAREVSEITRLKQIPAQIGREIQSFEPVTIQKPRQKPSEISKVGQKVTPSPAMTISEEFGLSGRMKVGQVPVQKPRQKVAQRAAVAPKPQTLTKQKEKVKEKQREQLAEPKRAEKVQEKAILVPFAYEEQRRLRRKKGKKRGKVEEFAPVEMPFTSDRSFESTGFMKKKKQTKKQRKDDYGI